MSQPQGYILEELAVGMSAELVRVCSDRDIELFAEASGDFNPVHVDEAFAAATAFRGRIAHGLLPASYVSAVVGTLLPGPGALYLHQTLSFSRPTRPGDTVTARVTVKEIDPTTARVILTTECLVNGETALEGEATVRVPRRRRPARASS